MEQMLRMNPTVYNINKQLSHATHIPILQPRNNSPSFYFMNMKPTTIVQKIRNAIIICRTIIDCINLTNEQLSLFFNVFNISFLKTLYKIIFQICSLQPLKNITLLESKYGESKMA